MDTEKFRSDLINLCLFQKFKQKHQETRGFFRGDFFKNGGLNEKRQKTIKKRESHFCVFFSAAHSLTSLHSTPPMASSSTATYDSVKEYYGKLLQKSSDLKTNACTTAGAPPKYIRYLLICSVKKSPATTARLSTLTGCHAHALAQHTHAPHAHTHKHRHTHTQARMWIKKVRTVWVKSSFNLVKNWWIFGALPLLNCRIHYCCLYESLEDEIMKCFGARAKPQLCSLQIIHHISRAHTTRMEENNNNNNNNNSATAANAAFAQNRGTNHDSSSLNHTTDNNNGGVGFWELLDFIVKEPPPQLPRASGGSSSSGFSPQFCDFVDQWYAHWTFSFRFIFFFLFVAMVVIFRLLFIFVCFSLQKTPEDRPSAASLLDHSWFKLYPNISATTSSSDSAAASSVFAQWLRQHI